MIKRVILSRAVEKRLKRVPRHVVLKLLAWVDAVECDGLEETRKIPGFHDEPLRGRRRGQRSIRLSKSWRAIYRVKEDGEIEFVEVEEIHHHEY